MIESIREMAKSARQLLALAALMIVGYTCIRTLRFTFDILNQIFACAYLW